MTTEPDVGGVVGKEELSTNNLLILLSFDREQHMVSTKMTSDT